MRCEPWGPACGREAAESWLATCCGRVVYLCLEHAPLARLEVEEEGRYCLVCGAVYAEAGGWVVLPAA